MGYYMGVKIKLDDTKHGMKICNYIKLNYKNSIIRKLKVNEYTRFRFEYCID